MIRAQPQPIGAIVAGVRPAQVNGTIPPLGGETGAPGAFVIGTATMLEAQAALLPGEMPVAARVSARAGMDGVTRALDLTGSNVRAAGASDVQRASLVRALVF